MGHKHGEVGEMAAGARSVCFIPGDELAALRGPVPRHAPLRVVPEGAVGVVVVLCLENNAKTKLWKQLKSALKLYNTSLRKRSFISVRADYSTLTYSNPVCFQVKKFRI